MTPVPVYLDYNATAPIKPAVAEAVADALRIGANPSSVHRPGRRARQAIEAARGQVAALAGARPADVIFTSGGTEANNLALAGRGRGARLVVSAIEHDSVLAPATRLESGRILAPVAADGRLDLAALDVILATIGTTGDPPVLVSVMLANNETGVIQPVAEISRIARAHGATVHCDAVQAAGKIPIDFAQLDVDMLSLSAHKIAGPAGVGALVVRGGLPFAAGQGGGGQELGRRAGTENLAGIVGFGVAAALAPADFDRAEQLAGWRDLLERRLVAAAPAACVFGAAAPRLPNTSCVMMPGVASELQVIALDLAGVAISAGAACSSGKVAASHVLGAMGASAAAAGSAIRISTGWASRYGDIDRLVEAWTALYMRKKAA